MKRSGCAALVRDATRLILRCSKYLFVRRCGNFENFLRHNGYYSHSRLYFD